MLRRVTAPRALRMAPAIAVVPATQRMWCADKKAADDKFDPDKPQGPMDKAKKELKKMLKMQLIIMPITLAVMMYMYPPMSADEEKKLRAKYEKSAGWKT